MKKLFLLLFTILLIISGGSARSQNSKGYLVVIGGGVRPDYITEKMIELAGGYESKFAIIPMASSVPLESAEGQKKDLSRLGVKHIEIILCDSSSANSDSILNKIKGVNAVYFTGGDQARLAKALLGTRLLKEIKNIYSNGGLVGGTCAGASVMSKIMITGNELLNLDSSSSFTDIMKGNIQTTEGFGFITSAIIDQHFILRKRHNRLISIVLENPELLGIGIDESTSIVVKPDNTFEVLGEREVIIYDASSSTDINVNPLGLISASNLKMHILNSGKKFDMNNKSLIE